MSVLGFAPNHVPLKHRCPDYCYVGSTQLPYYRVLQIHSHSYLETSEIQVHVGIWKSAIAIAQLNSYTYMHAMSIVCVSFARVHHPDSWLNEVLPWNRFQSSLFLGELEPPDWETKQPKNSSNSSIQSAAQNLTYGGKLIHCISQFWWTSLRRWWEVLIFLDYRGDSQI
jgi:hypothetical protein